MLLVALLLALAAGLDAILSTWLFVRPVEIKIPNVRFLVPLSASYELIDIRDLTRATGDRNEKPRVLIDLRASANSILTMRVYVPQLAYEIAGAGGDLGILCSTGVLTQEVLLHFMRASGARDKGQLDKEASEVFRVVSALASGQRLDEIDNRLEYHRAEEPVFLKSAVQRPWPVLAIEAGFWFTVALLLARKWRKRGEVPADAVTQS